MGTSETLRAVIDAGRAAKRLDELSTARVIGKVAEQIHQAQQRAGAGKAVGPITPAGISIDSKGVPKLGLAEPTAYAYASPEQVRGGDGDRRSDVFSLGVLMWEALTHQALFEADSEAAIKAAVAEREIVAPSALNANVPVELGTICMKALARNAAERYQSAKVMAAEIEAVLDDAGYGNSDDKIAAYIASLGRSSAANRPTGKLPASVATAALPPPRRTGMTNPPLTSAAPPLPSVPAPPVLPVPASPVPSVPASPVLPVPASPVQPTSASPVPAPASPLPSAPASPLPSVPLTPSSVPSVLGRPAQGPVTPAPATVPDVGVPATAPGFAGAPGMTPIPTDAVPAAASSIPTTLIGGIAGPAPAPLPPPPSEPRPSQPVPDHQGRSHVAPPHPAGAVSLPSKAKETELLGGWGWGTGAHPKVEEHDDLDDEPPARNPLPLIIGGGIAVAGIIVAVALALGGDGKRSKKSTTPPGATASSTYDPHSVNAPRDAALADSPGAVVDAAPPPVDSRSAVDAAPADAPPPPAPIDAAPQAAAATAKPPPPAPVAATTGSADDKPITTKPAHVDLPAKRADKAGSKQEVKTQNATTTPKKDPEQPYRQGLQMFMRGDTSGALTALRASLAANSNYAPAWRAMGLVFEKLGDTDQARRALRRYLQLAPGASDAEQVRNRLERLGQ